MYILDPGATGVNKKNFFLKQNLYFLKLGRGPEISGAIYTKQTNNLNVPSNENFYKRRMKGQNGMMEGAVSNGLVGESL